MSSDRPDAINALQKVLWLGLGAYSAYSLGQIAAGAKASGAGLAKLGDLADAVTSQATSAWSPPGNGWVACGSRRAPPRAATTASLQPACWAAAMLVSLL